MPAAFDYGLLLASSIYAAKIDDIGVAVRVEYLCRNTRLLAGTPRAAPPASNDMGNHDGQKDANRNGGIIALAMSLSVASASRDDDFDRWASSPCKIDDAGASMGGAAIEVAACGGHRRRRQALLAILAKCITTSVTVSMGLTSGKVFAPRRQAAICRPLERNMISEMSYFI